MPRRAALATAALCAAAALPAAASVAAVVPTPTVREAARTPAATSPVPVPSTVAARLHAARTFALALGANRTQRTLVRLSHRDLVVVDGERDETSPAQVRRLQAHGAVVLGYLSVGTIESWRSWYPALKPHRLKPVADWPGESYADLASPGARTELADVVAPEILGRGFDGLFLDNVDMVETHPEQAAAMLDLVQRIAARVHGRGGVLMAQNGDSVIDPLLPSLDAWNREDPTNTYDFASRRYQPTDRPGRRLARQTIRRIRAAGLLVTTTDYFRSSRAPGAARAVRIACRAGAVPFVSNIELTTVPPKAPRCP